MAPILGYWDLRGRGEPIRCLLYYTGTEFEDKRYKFGPNCSRDEWMKVKSSMDLDFPNLPYFIDGDVKMTQTFAIMRHIASQHGLNPTLPPSEMWRAEMAELEVVEFLLKFSLICHDAEAYEREKVQNINNLCAKLKAFSKFLGDNLWMLGDQLTHVDFLFHEGLDRYRYLSPDCMEQFPNLKKYFERFEALPNVGKYLKSDKFKRWPINGPYAKFGGSEDPPIL